MRKYDRQRLILSLIENQDIDTQEELTELLKERGIIATQATISRDIKELRITKVQTSSGAYKYTVIDTMRDTLNERLIKVFKSSVLAFKVNRNKIYVNTISYAATVVAQAIVTQQIPGIAGIIAGHDTILLDIEEDYDLKLVLQRLKDMMNS